jgi:DNA-binding transcriptional ArsR family regulator
MIQVVRDTAKAAALLQPARLQMLDLLRQEPNSGSGIARRMDLPRQQVNYHLRELEKEGFVEFVEERRRGNCMERIVRSAAQSFVVSPEALGPVGAMPLTSQDRFSIAYLVGSAMRIIRDLAYLSRQAVQAGKRLSTITLETEIRFRSATERAAFAEELAQTLATLTAKYHDEKADNGRRFRFVAGGYPVITKPQKKEDVADGESVSIQ